MSELLSHILNAPLDSPAILVLSVAYLIVASIRIYDARLVQGAGKAGGFYKGRWFYSRVAERAEGQQLPVWVSAFHWLGWAIFIVLLVLDWRYALALYAVLFLLRVLPVLETIGSFLMAPFLRKE